MNWPPTVAKGTPSCLQLITRQHYIRPAASMVCGLSASWILPRTGVFQKGMERAWQMLPSRTLLPWLAGYFLGTKNCPKQSLLLLHSHTDGTLNLSALKHTLRKNFCVANELYSSSLGTEGNGYHNLCLHVRRKLFGVGCINGSAKIKNQSRHGYLQENKGEQAWHWLKVMLTNTLY